MANSFRCTLVTPQEQVLDTSVSYASIPAWDGLMGVAPMRAPLVAKLTDGQLRLETVEDGIQLFFIGGGFAQMKGDVLSLVVERATPADQIDRQEAEQALEQALAQVATTEEETTAKQRQVNSARAMLRLAQ